MAALLVVFARALAMAIQCRRTCEKASRLLQESCDIALPVIVPCHDFDRAESGKAHSGKNPCGDGGGEADVHQPQSGKERREEQPKCKEFQSFPALGCFLNQNGRFHALPRFPIAGFDHGGLGR